MPLSTVVLKSGEDSDHNMTLWRLWWHLKCFHSNHIEKQT